ncbi:MAG: DUF4831 family protein [Bacteroidales bacterium]|nr:DUF4831 family protein [Bacteroidales bacterium]
MKKMICTAAAVVMLSGIGASAQNYKGTDPMGTVSYALPQTCLTLEVEAQQQKFFAGPYAKYAQKYLGIDAQTEDKSTFQVTSVKLTPYVEADQTRRFLITPGNGGATFLQMSAQGLISITDGNFGQGSQFRFTKPSVGDFAGKGVSSNITSEATTLYKTQKDEDVYNKIAVQQNMVVEKSLDKKAQEAADMIFDLREKRIQIVTGDTDATYRGEAMAAAIAEIKALEQEYMMLFIGYSEYQTQTMKFDVVPSADAKSQVYVAFRLSDNEGLVASDNMSGKPYLLELDVKDIERPVNQVSAGSVKGQTAVYRIPAICGVKLTDGVNILLQDRVAVYQLGTESTYQISTK